MPRGVYVRTKEILEKLRQANLGKKLSPETKEKIRKGNLGKKISIETKEKQSIAQIKRFKDPEQREKHRQAAIKQFSDPKTKEKHKQPHNTSEVIKKHRQANIKRFEDPKEREKTSQGQLKRFQNPIEREKLSKLIKKGWKNPKSREKARKSAIKRIERNNGYCYPGFNSKACEYFKKFDKEHNTKGFYAMYGGGEHYIEELGYFPDYINFDLKLIMEFDESHHFENGKLRERDVQRQKEIQKYYPDFEFFRIKEE